MDSKKARKLKEGFLVKKVGKFSVNFEDIHKRCNIVETGVTAIANQMKIFDR